MSFKLVNGKVQPSLHNIIKVAAVTTYGGSRFRAMLMGDPPRKLILKWRHELNPDLKAEGDALCTIEIEEKNGVCKLSIDHRNDAADPSKLINAVSGGWPKILSNLKSLLETGHTIAI